MMRCRVKHNCVLVYGTMGHARITLNVGQIWEYINKLTKPTLLHTLERQNLLLEITNADFERYFELVESKG